MIHSEETVNELKTKSAKKTIARFNRHTEIITFETRITPQNADELIGGKWDVIMDGSDNVATRYLINDACVKYKKPLVSGSAL